MGKVLEIARHELWVAVRTQRFIWIAAIYLLFALLGGAVLIIVARVAERTIIEEAVAQGLNAEQAAEVLAQMSDPLYQKIVAWFADSDRQRQVAASLQSSAVLLFFFWGSLKFLPFLILLTSFDQVAGDLQSRSICYTVLRARRRDVLYGKLIAQTAVFIAVTAVGSLVLGVVAAVALESVSIGDVLLGMLRMWLALLPFGLCYLAISAACSSFFREPFVAMMAALGLILLLWSAQLFGYVPANSYAGWLRHITLVSPAVYEDGLWHAGIAAPAWAAVAHLGFALVFVAAATWRLAGRDL